MQDNSRPTTDGDNSHQQHQHEFSVPQGVPQSPIIQFFAYKATRLSDIVCRRSVRLYRDKLKTVHPNQSGQDQGTEKTWLLDRTCKLEPEYVDELVSEKRTVRPPGQWTVTAKLTTVTGQAQEAIDLYCVTIHWPTSWLATKGYTSFTLGFETVQEAAQWHALVQRQLSALRVRAVSSKGDSSSAGHSSKPSYDEGLGLRSAGSANGVGGVVTRKTSQGFVAAALEHFWSGSVAKDDKQLSAALNGCDQGLRHTPRSPPANCQELGSCSGLLSQQLPACYDAAGPEMCSDAQLLQHEADSSFTTSSTDGCDGTAQLVQQAHNAAAAAAAGGGVGGVEQRWVPYRHTNGVAIYHHKESAATCSLWDCGQAPAADDGGAGPAGSEYMASSIVKGCPDECLSVLVDLSSNTTILGPASKIELLEDGEERQVLRLVVEATGMARRLCAPREVIVERLFKREECGVDVILFSSCEEPPVVHSSPSLKRRHHRTATGAAAAAGAASPSAAGSSIAGGGLHNNNSSNSGSSSSTAGGINQHSHRVVPGALAAAAALGVAAVAAALAGSLLGCSFLLLVAAGVLASCARLSSSSTRFQSLWYKPVRAYVQGGYTISPREDCNAINSPECLVTCILKVDLRGFLGERSWLRPILDALGWVDAYVERMLMAVILVKDEVEQQRFLVQPFSILTNNHTARASSSMVTAAAASAGGSSAAGGDACDDSQLEAATLREGYSQHLRQQQLMRQRRRQLQIQQQQQQQMQHAVYSQQRHPGQHISGGYGQQVDDAARMAAQAYWGSGMTCGSQAGMRAGMYAGAGGGPHGLSNGAFPGPDYYGMQQWPYKGPLIGAVGVDGRPAGGPYSRQQQAEMMLQDVSTGQHKRGSSHGRQQGRLGRMASRIYSLRPRLRKGDSDGERGGGGAGAAGAAGGSSGPTGAVGSALAAASAAGVGLYSQLSASFKNGLAALSSSSESAAAAAVQAADEQAAEGSLGTAAEGAAGRAGSDAAAGAGAGAASGPTGLPSSDGAAGGGDAVTQQSFDVSDTATALARLGLSPDTAIVAPQYYIGGPQGPAAKCSSLNHRYWGELHVPGTPAPFKLRGASYLADRTKVDGGMPQFVLGSVDLVETAGPTQHISRFLPAVRGNDAAYSFVVNLIIPGTPVLSLVAVFINEHHPDILDGPSCSSSSSANVILTQHQPSKSSPDLQLQQQHKEDREQQQQHGGGLATLRRLSSSSTNLPCAGSGGGFGAAGTGAAGGGEGGPGSRYETPVGGRAYDAGSDDDGGGSSSAGAAAAARGISSDDAATHSAPAAMGVVDDEDDDGGDEDGSSSTGGPSYQRPRDVNDWQPFDFALHRFLHGGPQTRQSMFKLIPHIAEGSWVIKQSVGTVPVILGNKLQTVYYQTDRYIEATVDVTSSSAAAYITSMVRGATKSLVIDLGFVLEGQRPEELPEALLGAFRLNHLDCSQAKRIDTTQELPLLPRPLQQHQLPLMAAAARAAAAAAALAADANAVAAGGGGGGSGGAAAGGASGGAAQAAAGTAAAAVGGGSGSELGLCWQGGDMQRRACSASGAMPSTSTGATAAAAGGGGGSGAATVQQQSQGAEQQQQQPSRGSLTARARNSASVVEAGRTMTGHARSRSAASAEELYLTSGLLLDDSREQQRRPSNLQLSSSNNHQQQQLVGGGKEPAAREVDAAALCSTNNASNRGSNSCAGPPSIKTSVAVGGGAVAAAAAAGAGVAAADGSAGGAAATAAGTPGGGVGAGVVGGVVPSAARQLFGSRLLPFGSSNSGVLSTAAGPDRPQSSSAHSRAAGAATPSHHSTASLQPCGAVTSLSGSSTPTAAAAAAAAGVASPQHTVSVFGSSSAAAGGGGSSSGLLMVNTGGSHHSASHHHHHHHHRSSLSSTPTSAAAAAAAARGGVVVGSAPNSANGSMLRTVQHHRTSSGTSDVTSASRPAGPGWPASPPSAGQEPSASKLSAAAFISRAHAAALAASAQRRGQRSSTTPNANSNTGGVYGSPGFSSFGSQPGGGLSSSGFAGVVEQLSGSPGAAAAATTPAHSGVLPLAGAGGAVGAAGGVGSSSAADAAELLAGGGGWLSKRPRGSSSGVPDAVAPTGGLSGEQQLARGGSLAAAQYQQQVAEGSVSSAAGCGPCAKISASEQLRLTHHALRWSATGGAGASAAAGGGSGSGNGHQQHAGGSLLSSTSTSGVLGGASGVSECQSFASGGPMGGGAGAADGAGTVQQQPVKRRMSGHRRFASMGAMQ